MIGIKKFCFYSLVLPIGSGFVVFVVTNVMILAYGGSRITSDVHELPHTPIGLVFGGGMKSPTEMSDMQTDRMKRGVELYNLKKIDKLMLTGDDGAFRSNEIAAMRAYALSAGVPETDILTDPHGYRTYESCYREHYVYGLTSTIAISQSFHLPRIRYFCEHFGIKTLALAADLRDYHEDRHSIWTMYGRESLARVKGWWHVAVTKPLPRTLSRD